MYRIYHYPLCPFSRKVRVALHEKQIPFHPTVEYFWERRDSFIKLNTMGTVPFLMGEPHTLISHSQTIIEFLEEAHPDLPLMPQGPVERAEVRRICAWFDDKFYREVSEYILNDKVYKFFKTGVTPNASILKIARSNISYHLDYIEFLLSIKTWLGGNEFSIADITAACHISSLDYLSEIPWESNRPLFKEWYSVVKSRPSFREILLDYIPGFEPSKTYSLLDF